MATPKVFTWKCRDCGTENKTDNPAVKVCKKCSLNHDGLTNEEQAEYDALVKQAEVDGLTVAEEEDKVAKTAKKK